MAADAERLRALRDRLNKRLHEGLDEIYINGSMEHRLPHNLNISFAYVEGESLLMGINDVAVSSGSACTSASLEPSYVLEGARRRRRSGALLDPFRPRPLHHRGGSRLRGSEADRRSSRGCATCRRSTRWPRKASISRRCNGKCTESPGIAESAIVDFRLVVDSLIGR